MPEIRTRAGLPDDRLVRRRWRALLTSLAVALAVASVPVAAWAIPTGAPPAQEDETTDTPAAGETIADGRARLPRGDIVWTIRQIDVPGGEGLAVDEFALGFALVEEGTVVLRVEDEETPTQIAAGEAAFFPDRKAGTLASAVADAASLYEIALVSQRDAQAASEGGDDGEIGVIVGEPFPAPQGAAPQAGTPESETSEGEEPEAATFEIALVGNTLSGQDTATIPVSGSGAPVFYLTTEGTAQLRAGEQVVDLAAGQFALLAGEVQVRAAGEQPATFVVAAIGEEAEARERGERAERAGREDRQRVRDGGAQADGAPRAGRTREGRTPRVRTGGGGGGGGRGGGGQGQQPGPGAPGGQPGTGDPTVPPTAPGTPGVDPTPEATIPVEPTVPIDGTPPPGATIPPEATTPPEATIPPTEETAVPTEPVPPIETPIPEPTIAVPPTNPPVPPVPGVPTVPPEAPPAEEPPPVEETPAAPIEEEAAVPAADA